MVNPEMVSKQDATTSTIDEDDVEHCSHTSAQNLVQTIERVLSDFASGITEKLEKLLNKQSELSLRVFKLGSVLLLYTTAEQVDRLSSQKLVKTSLP